MSINSKFVYVKNKELFEPLIPSIPKNLNPIVFIEDTREMWTCGTYFSIGYPSIEVVEESGSVKVSIGNSYFSLTTSGDSISVRKGDGNKIIISSNALNKVDTQKPLKWDEVTKQLLHMDSGVTPGSYGQSSSLSNTSTFVIPNIIVDSTGHVTQANNYNIQIRDYVEQINPSEVSGDKNILLSYNDNNNNSDSAPVRKARGLLFNNQLQHLTVQGGITSNNSVNVSNGDLVVTNGYIVGNLKGDVEGEAKPKIHLSKKPEYGGASTQLYGHVLLSDEVPNEEPEDSSNNDNANNANVTATAASPKMVWNAVQSVYKYVDENGIKLSGYKNKNKIDIKGSLTFSQDFQLDDSNNLYIGWEEYE